MVTLGLTLYHWGTPQQNRLLADCLVPALAELKRDGFAGRLWFDRFDARGPHLLVLVTVSEAATQTVASRLSAQLEAYMVANPSKEELNAADLDLLHAQCRGKVQCEADSLPEIAANNTFSLFEHPLRGYPFWLSAGLPFEEELWELLEDLALWSISQAASSSQGTATAAATRWIAGLDRELASAGVARAAYWRYHATTLILTLEERLATQEAEILSSLDASLGDRNRQALGRAWKVVEAGGDDWPLLPRLVRLAFADAGWPLRRHWMLMREVVHSALKQLGLPVSLHIPLVLFAWQKSSLESHSAPSS
ncbi:MAG TPA: lantibiotic dehydratase C-terminal domain-containing protein [Thermoanaerobaculia bacterium]|jgi:hypothetical protein|nr:lantibiotic dehydratase C-terminal domain-containing protein [Thermoanaerobaculia bacterium]